MIIIMLNFAWDLLTWGFHWDLYWNLNRHVGENKTTQFS